MSVINFQRVAFLPHPRLGAVCRKQPSRNSRRGAGRLSVVVNSFVRNGVEIKRSPDSKQTLELSELTAIGPLDGRYGGKLKELRNVFSEFGLIRYRVFVECAWLQYLSNMDGVSEVPQFSSATNQILERLKHEFTLEDAQKVKDYERTTNHDVKAVEYFLKDVFRQNKELNQVLEFTHFGCTSEDINNLAYGLMIKESLNSQVFPLMESLVTSVAGLAEDYSDVPMLARTHGQPASPTTMGKEMANFAYHLAKDLRKIKDIPIYGKMAGAVGNYNAHLIAYPSIDWPMEASRFVKSLSLEWNPYVTQIEPHYYLAEIFHAVERFNTILLDFDRDVWGYISLNYFKQRTIKGEIGSSTMPHKVNPIDFENSEGNLGIANALLLHLASKLPISRFQRDLSDSTVLRNVGVAIGHSYLAYQSSIRGIQKLFVDEDMLKSDLEDHWELLSEAIQTIMRKYGVPEPYEKLKELTRGKTITQSGLVEFIKSLDIPDDVKSELLDLSPERYTGNATEQAKNLKQFLERISKREKVKNDSADI